MKAFCHSIQDKNKTIKALLLAGFILLNLHTHSQANSQDEWQKYQTQAIQHFEAGQYTQAMHKAEQGLKRAETAQGQTAPYQASSLNIMATIADAQANSTLAIGYMQRAVKLMQDSVGSHENTATLLFNLAQFYHHGQQLEQAKNSLEQADSMLQNLMAKQSTAQLKILQAKVLSEMQKVLLAQGQTQQAQHYAQRQYQLMQQENTSDSNSVQQQLSAVRARIILAQTFQQQQQWPQSDEILADVFKRLDSLKMHVPTGEWQDDYADALEIQSKNADKTELAPDRHKQALAFYLQLPESLQKKYRSRIAHHYNELGFYFFDKKQFVAAEQSFVKARPWLQQAFGENSIEYARLLGNFAQAKEGQSELAEALAFYQQAQQIYAPLVAVATSLEASRPLRQAYSQSFNNSAVVQYKLGQYQEAEQTWQHALTLFEQDSSEHSQQSKLAVMENLLRFYQSQQRATEAKQLQYQISQLKKSTT